MTDLDQLICDIRKELVHARMKFPGGNATMMSLLEKVTELAHAACEEHRADVRNEVVQVAVLALRVVLDGDATLNVWRKSKGLDPLVAPLPKATP